MVAAVFYAVTDRWLLARISKHKSLKMFLIVPVLLYVFSWGLLQITSPSMPYFTKEEAVDYATNVKGTITDYFPKEIGEKVEIISGYEVIRETKAEEATREVYIVTFIETWSNEEVSGMWYTSYKVKRGQSTIYDQGGSNPPYR